MFENTIEPRENKVTAYTKTILPYYGNLKKEDPRKQYVQKYKSDLCEAFTKNLLPTTTSKLYASYTVKKGAGTRKRRYDIENVLFYNVSRKAFKDLLQNGFYFEERPQTDVDSWDAPYDHKYYYSVEEQVRFWKQKEELVSLPNVYFNSVGDMQHLLSVWEAFMKAHTEAFTPTKYDGHYGIDLTISVPNNLKNFPLHNIQKPLLDGVICSLQSFVRVEDEAKIMNEKARRNYELVQSIYEDCGHREGLIKADKLLHVGPKGGLHWHPADDKLVCCNVSVTRTNSTSQEIVVAGSVYTVQRAD
jgi:hypothetical protein